LLKPNAENLPSPDEPARKQSQLLKQSVQAACDKAGGWINFSEYMDIALYQPALGYYSGGLQKFGQKGDFITAPEVSPLFGQCLANQISEVFNTMRQANKDEVYLIEFGAGSGVLAADILLQLEALSSLPAQYYILELSAELKQRQAETIKENAGTLVERVHWLSEMPKGLRNAVVVANEVLDAMPVECFKVSTNKIESLMVGFDNNELVSCYKTADSSVVKKIETIQQRSEFVFSIDYASEFNPAIFGWLSELESMADNMVVLLIDYGYNELEYFHEDRTDGTLMCYYQHRAHNDFFWWPGLQDITAFVNFTDVAYSASDLGMDVSGYTTQAAFLLANGISDLHAAQVTDEVQQQIKLSQQIKTLTLPSEMGDRFKVLAITKNHDEPLAGFSMLDLRNRL